jgi:hypothetical protein
VPDALELPTGVSVTSAVIEGVGRDEPDMLFESEFTAEGLGELVTVSSPVLERVVDADSDARVDADSALLALTEPVADGDAIEEREPRADEDGKGEMDDDSDGRAEGDTLPVPVVVEHALVERAEETVAKFDAVAAGVTVVCAETVCENVAEDDAALDGESAVLRVSIGVRVPSVEAVDVDCALNEGAAETEPRGVVETAAVIDVDRDATPLSVTNEDTEAESDADNDDFALADTLLERDATAEGVVDADPERDFCAESETRDDEDAKLVELAKLEEEADEIVERDIAAELEADSV